MDFSTQLDDLQQRAANAKQAAQAAVSESRDQLRQRIDQAKVDVDLAAKGRPPGRECGRGQRQEQVGADEGRYRRQNGRPPGQDRQAGRPDRRQHRRRRRGLAEDDAAAAIDYASWTVDNARLAVLDAIDARAYADELAAEAGA
jgi:hypothetical protein